MGKQRHTGYGSLLFFCFIIPAFFCRGSVDSLVSRLGSSALPDSARTHLLNKLAVEYMRSDPDSALFYADEALKFAVKTGSATGRAEAHHNIGYVHYMRGNYELCLYHWKKTLDLRQSANDKKNIAPALGNIGVVYQEQGNNTLALEYYLKALKIGEELNDKNRIAVQLGNIGSIYQEQGDNEKALDYYLEALKLKEELGKKSGIAITLGNIGIIYQEQRDYSKALDYFNRSIKIAEKAGEKNGVSRHLGNIGIVYEEMGNNERAVEYYLKALKMDEELGDKSGMAIWLGNLGAIYTKTGRFGEAEEFIQRSLDISSEIGSLKEMKFAHDYFVKLYDTLGNYKKAYIHFKKFTEARDSIINEEKNKEMTRLELNYEFEKKEAAARAAQEKKDALAEATLERQKLLNYSVIGGLVLILVFAAIVFRSLKATQKQKKIVEEQKLLVDKKNRHIEEKQKEIIDSINYAKRLQSAILAKESDIKNYFPESFLLYRPKDIVAGDFYFFESTASHLFYAACDCTGHGVPGAMVSVVCSNALGRAVKEFGLADTGMILNKVTDLVLETFEKSGLEVKDGMDVSLIAFNKQTREIQWSGANNPLWYFQNGNINELVADKQPVGKYERRKPFSVHTIKPAESGTALYLFTDGYADQFGLSAEAKAKAEGILNNRESTEDQVNLAKATLIKGKKFKYSQLEKLLISIQDQSMAGQQKILNDTIDRWKGSLEQVDDICIIGIRV